MPPTSVVVLTSEFPPMVGGVATFAAEISGRLTARGHTALVVAAGRSGVWHICPLSRVGGTKVLDAPFYARDTPRPLWYFVYPLSFITFFLTAAMAIAFNRAPILAAYWFPDGYLAYLVTRVLKRDYHVVVHGLDVVRVLEDPRKRRRLVRVLANATTVICRSEYTSRIVIELGVPHDRVRMITDGADPELLYPNEEEGSRVRSELGLADRKVLFTLGRLVERKGHAMVLKAMPRLIQSFPDVIYLIGGSGPEGANLRRLSAELGIDDNVVFLGRVADEDIRAYYNASDVFVMPNHVGRNPWDVEGFGIVFLEAAACGKPVIGGASGGAPDAIQDGVTGYCVPERDRETLESRILELLSDEESRHRMGSAGRQRILESFTWESVTSKYVDAMNLPNRD